MSIKNAFYHEPEQFYRSDIVPEEHTLEGWQVYGEERYCPDYLLDERWMETQYPGYFISNCGRLYNANTDNILKPKRMDRAGHVGYCISVRDGYGNRRVIYRYAHRLVAEAFIENPYNLPIVRHINDVKNDNYYENLMWGTMYDNHIDSVINGGHKPITDEQRQMSKEITRRPVLVTKLNTNDQWFFPSVADAVRYTGVQQANAIKVLTGKRLHTQGYYFEYITREEEEEYRARRY